MVWGRLIPQQGDPWYWDGLLGFLPITSNVKECKAWAWKKALMLFCMFCYKKECANFCIKRGWVWGLFFCCFGFFPMVLIRYHPPLCLGYGSSTSKKVCLRIAPFILVNIKTHVLCRDKGMSWTLLFWKAACWGSTGRGTFRISLNRRASTGSPLWHGKPLPKNVSFSKMLFLLRKLVGFGMGRKTEAFWAEWLCWCLCWLMHLCLKVLPGSLAVSSCGRDPNRS